MNVLMISSSPGRAAIPMCFAINLPKAQQRLDIK